MIVNASPRWTPRAIARLIARIVVCLVGAFWTWFIAMNVISDGSPSVLPALAVFTPLALVMASVWRWPALGGALAIAAGLAAGWLFPHPAPLVMMALPLCAGGLTLLLCSRGE